MLGSGCSVLHWVNPNEKKNSIQLDTEDVMDDEVVITVTNIEPIGRKHYRKFRMMMMINCCCGMVDQRKAFNLISSRDQCQRSSPSRISNTLRAGFEPVQNLISGFVEWSCAVVITATPRCYKNIKNIKGCWSNPEVRRCYKEKQVPKFQGIKQKGEICKAQVHTTKASC